MSDTGRAPGEVLVVSRGDVEKLLTAEACVKRLDTFRWVGAGEVEQTNPVNLYVHDRSQPEPEFGHGVVQAFPAMIRPLQRAAVKWLGSYRQNPKTAICRRFPRSTSSPTPRLGCRWRSSMEHPSRTCALEPMLPWGRSTSLEPIPSVSRSSDVATRAALT